MIVPAVLSHRHILLQPYLDQLATRVRDIVQNYCDLRGYAFVGRLKTAESLAEKVETGRFATWDSLEDFYGCTIVIPTLAHEDDTLAFLKERFTEVTLRSRGTSLKDPSVFRFDATRFIGKLKAVDFAGANPSLLQLTFEVQVRTAFEHAWSVTTHSLAYKGDKIDWRLLRLAAQMKATVEQLDSLILGFEQLASTIYEQNWPEVSSKRLVEDFFRSRVESGQIPEEVAPGSWVRFCDNFLALLLGTTTERVRDPRQLVKRALAVLAPELSSIESMIFPRSISLLQLTLGILVKRDFIREPFSRYVPLITPELLTLFPEVAKLGSGFDWRAGLEIEPVDNPGSDSMDIVEPESGIQPR